jgi:hypothetical protein
MGSLLQGVESTDPVVVQTGTWTAHATDVASGGNYLYSSGSFDDILSLGFMGTQVEVIYVKHPALGTFAVEIDGTVTQLVNSVAAASEFGAVTIISGLTDSQHTLRIYPVVGVVALDAFGVEALVEQPAPTPTGTPIPTQDILATVLPPDQPTLTPTATNTLLPVTLPFVETFDNRPNWQAAGAWVFDTQTAYRGAGWFASSAIRGQLSTLTFTRQIDLRNTLNPELSFWQKSVLSGSDLFVVDVSLDCGLSWQPVDQQIGQVSDWTQRTLDLTGYRGSVLSLRFRLDTMNALPEGTTTAGIWVDELGILDTIPSLTPTKVPTGEPSLTSTPTATFVPPTATDWPTFTPTDVPTNTPVPTDTPTEVPTSTPLPNETPLPTAIPTETSLPSTTPTDVLNETPVPSPTQVPTS